MAGIILLAWARLAKSRVRLSRQEFITLLISGLLLWAGGNGLVNWSEQRTDSGLTALMIAATPIWVAIIEAILDRRLPSWRMVASLGIGFSGIAVLSWPVISQGIRADVLAIVGLLFAGFSWGLGTILQGRRPVGVKGSASSGYQQLFGSLGFIVLFFVSGEPIPHPTPEAWWAVAYLIGIGSLLGFTSYVRAIQLLPTSIVMTYGYVNPVIAVFLGWLILGEAITPWTLAGALLVLLGVAGVFNERRS